MWGRWLDGAGPRGQNLGQLGTGLTRQPRSPLLCPPPPLRAARRTRPKSWALGRALGVVHSLPPWPDPPPGYGEGHGPSAEPVGSVHLPRGGRDAGNCVQPGPGCAGMRGAETRRAERGWSDCGRAGPGEGAVQMGQSRPPFLSGRARQGSSLSPARRPLLPPAWLGLRAGAGPEPRPAAGEGRSPVRPCAPPYAPRAPPVRPEIRLPPCAPVRPEARRPPANRERAVSPACVQSRHPLPRGTWSKGRESG